MMKRVLGVLMILLLLTGLFACKKKGKEPAAEEAVLFEVTFSTTLLPYDSTPPESVTVKKGESVSEPTLQTTPTAGNRVIWTQSTSERTPYDFSSPVEKNFVLYAVEVPRDYKITYLLEIGTNSSKNPATYSAASETITLVDPILPLGYRFDKWSYFDDPDSRVTEIPQGSEGDIVLRAVWHKREFKILYYEEGEVNPNPTSYLFGEDLSLESPSRAGYRFTGFVCHGDRKLAVEEITSEFLLAHWNSLLENGIDIVLLATWEVES